MIGKIKSIILALLLIFILVLTSCGIINSNNDLQTSYEKATKKIIEENDFKMRLYEQTNTYTIIEYLGDDEHVVIPSTATDGIIIDSIGTAFIGNVKVKSIVLSDSIKYIHMMDFNKCVKLESIYIGSGVVEIEASETLAYCNRLTDITVSENNPKYYSENNCVIEKDTKKLILGCKNSVIPNYIEEIGSCAFYAIETLTELEIPDSVKKINGYAFWGCSSLKQITIKPSVEYIAQNAFGNCVNLTIYCLMPEKPQAWEDNWAAYRDDQTTVVWQDS